MFQGGTRPFSFLLSISFDVSFRAPREPIVDINFVQPSYVLLPPFRVGTLTKEHVFLKVP